MTATQPTTKERIVAAALETLKEEGFAGSSARAIARRGGFNQALIFYHFGTLNDLLLAALDATSAERLGNYRGAVTSAGSLEEKLRAAIELYRSDLGSGHVTVVSEMIGGSLSRPDLGPEVVARMEPWVELVEDAIRGFLVETGLASLVPPRTAALALVALSLGVNLMHVLEPDEERTDALFETAERVAGLILPMLTQPQEGR